MTYLPESRECLIELAKWIAAFVERRRQEGPRGDVVDAEIEGRPITPEEVVGTIQLLVLGGLETTAGVLGAAMLRFCEHPGIPAQLRARPELIPAAVEELLRAGRLVRLHRPDGPARRRVRTGGHQRRPSLHRLRLRPPLPRGDGRVLDRAPAPHRRHRHPAGRLPLPPRLGRRHRGW